MKTIMFHGSPGKNLLIAGLTVLLLIVACGKAEPTMTPMPPSATPTTLPPILQAEPTRLNSSQAQDKAHTPIPPAPTDTPAPPTNTPTSAAAQSTATPAPTLTPQASPDQPSVADVIASLQGLPIDEFFEQSHVQLQLRDPDNLISNGLDKEYGVAHNDRFSDISDAYVRETQQLEAAILDLLRAYDRSALSPEQQLSYDIYEWLLDDLVRRHEFTYYGYPVNSGGMWSLQFLLTSLLDNMPIASKSDAEDYVARLSQVDTWMEQLLEGLDLRQEAGVIPPQYVIQGAIPQIEGYIQTPEGATLNPRASHLYTSFRERIEQVDEISSQEKQALLDAAQEEIRETFIPAFTELRDYLVRLESVASDELGVGQFPRGEEFYDYVLRHWTSTDIRAGQLHELGLAEVARIQAEMRAVAVEMGYPADISMAEMDQLVAESDVLQGEELRQEYERLIAQAQQAAQEFFDLFPSAGVVVEYDPFAPPAYYRQPPRDGSGPGRMIVNLVDSAQVIFYNMYTLTHHETIPGHHVQYALAEELDLPKFRRDTLFDVARQSFTYQAFTDGWALYAQRLAWEMGLYGDDLLGNLGRLRQELHVAARLVVDTGIHAQGWSLQDATVYVEEATGMFYEPNRFRKIINIPGQVCGYNVGYFKILELRQRAMDRLGDQFDIRAFHNVILGHGPMPLQILERVVDDWIETHESLSTATPTATPLPKRLPAALQRITVENAEQVRPLAMLRIFGYQRAWPTGQCSVAFSPDGSLLAGACENSRLPVWDLPSLKMRHALNERSMHTTSCDFSPDGQMLVSGNSEDGAVIVWNPVTGEKILDLGKHQTSVWEVDFSPDGQLVTSCSAIARPDAKGDLCLWRISPRERLWIHKLPYGECLSVSFHPSGESIAYAMIHGLVEIVEVETGERIVLLEDATR
ncbi:MAG: DUF885 family protein, partial [Anaerolineae bacterium]